MGIGLGVIASPLIDYHVHESHSKDAPTATLPNLIEAAEAKGIEEMAFTSHLILEGEDMYMSVQMDELDEYFKQIEEAQRDTGVRLRAGLEVDYFPSQVRRIEAILDEHPLDFVLGSTHFVHGVDIGSREGAKIFFIGRPFWEATDEYFTVWKAAVETGLFDVMSHPDYWRKHLDMARAEPANWEEYGSVVLGAIDSLVSHDVGIEVNTSTVKYNLEGFYPTREFLEAARDAGVRKVTLGSDTHIPETLGYKIPEAARLLNELGFRHFSTFKGRVNSFMSLSYLIG
jgi:histidinol-phosphatase (PHP family)